MKAGVDLSLAQPKQGPACVWLESRMASLNSILAYLIWWTVLLEKNKNCWRMGQKELLARWAPVSISSRGSFVSLSLVCLNWTLGWTQASSAWIHPLSKSINSEAGLWEWCTLVRNNFLGFVDTGSALFLWKMHCWCCVFLSSILLRIYTPMDYLCTFVFA